MAAAVKGATLAKAARRRVMVWGGGRRARHAQLCGPVFTSIAISSFRQNVVVANGESDVYKMFLTTIFRNIIEKRKTVVSHV